MKKIIALFSLAISLFSIFPTVLFAQEEDSAVIIMYHRFGEEEFPTTNVTLEQIDQHIEELSKNIYNVVPLKVIINAIRNKQKLPPRTVAITIDDGYLSVYEEAWPRFKAANLPFTLFISTESVADQNESSMSWEQIREMEEDPLVEIGHHGHSHAHMTEIGMEDALTDIQLANEIYQKEIGYIPDIFAYPYGEYSDSLIDAISPQNYVASFAQYSSALNSSSNIMTLPRFAFNQNYADLNRFKLIINSRALPVRDVLPRSATLDVNPPNVGFTVDETVEGLESMNCFPSHMNTAATINRIGNNRIEVRFETPFPNGRHRINCTMPGPDNRWYWFGMPFFNLNETE